MIIQMNNRILKALIGLSALLLSFALSGSVNLPAVDVVVVADDCFTSTYDIIQAQLTDPRDEYIVCPDTYIKVGAPTIDLDSFGGGDWPLMALGSDVKILCGQTGSRNNNCTLESSFFHFMAVPDFPALGVIGVWADNLYVSGFTFTGTASAVNGLQPISVLLAAPGTNQIFNDIVWKDANIGTGLNVGEMPGITPDESLPDLSTHVTLRDSTFYRVTYSQQLITMNRQSFRARRNQFADVSVSNKDCSTCITSLIVCSTGKNDIITSDAYCSLIGNCFHTVEASEAIVRLEKHGQSNLFLAQNNNHVEEFSIVGSLPEDKTCALGQGISTEIDADIEACEELADTLSCPLGSMYLHSEKAESSPDDAGVPLTNTDAPVADEDTPSDNAANTATSTTTDSTTDVAEEEASPDDVGIPLLPLLKRHPGCTQFDPCDRCTGDCDFDHHCKGDLKCFQREGPTALAPVPGCAGEGRKGIDYCYSPDHI